MAGAGVVIALATLAFGELVAPYTEEAAKGLRLKATRSIVAREFRSGFWVKDDRSFVNIQDVTADTQLLNLRIYEFDPTYRLTSISRAEKGDLRGPEQVEPYERRAHALRGRSRGAAEAALGRRGTRCSRRTSSRC